MYISSTANNKSLIYKCPRLAQSCYDLWCYTHPWTCWGTLLTVPPIHGSHIRGWWMSNGWDAGQTSPSLPGAPNAAPGAGCLAVPHGAQGGGQVPSGWWPLVAPVQWHSFSPAVPPVSHLQTLPGKYQYL